LLVVGAVALSQAPRWLAVAGLALIVLAAAPSLYLRASQYYTTDPETGWPTRTWLLALERPPIARGFRMDVGMTWQLRDLLDELERDTAPGEAIFVYPSEPLVYVLADRPNPTRYSHVYPGLPTAVVQQIVATLEQTNVMTVVVSDGWLDYWRPNGGGETVLDDYLRTRFTEAQRFGVYRVLRRGAA
jgi:hypothetical protein